MPADSHVHTEWSWNAPEHVDHTVWQVALDELDDDHFLVSLASPDGMLTPPKFDAVGYLEAIEGCRLVTQDDMFVVVAHIDYPIRYWPEHESGRFNCPTRDP